MSRDQLNERLRTSVDWIVRLSDATTVIIMTAAFAVMIASIYFRYVLNDSLLWSDELLVWALVWVVMLGSVGVMAQWRHVYVPAAVLALPLRWRIPTLILSKILTMIFIALLVFYGTDVFMQKFHRTSPGLAISTRWEKLAIPVGCALMLWVGLIQIFSDIRAWRAANLEHFASYGDSDLDI
jgi:TRAP-type transport system small permease protein